MNNFTNNILTLLALLLLTQVSYSQKAKKTIAKDPSKYITKYDQSFYGVGPEVYFLPSPRTREEVLAEQVETLKHKYSQIAPFNDTIQRALLHQNLVKRYESTENASFINNYITTNPIKLNDWEKTVNNLALNNDEYFVAGLLNEIAKQYIIQNESTKAETILQKALEISPNDSFSTTIEENLSALYFYNKKYREAIILEENKYKNALSAKSSLEQGMILVKIAKLHAYNNNCNLAEETVIKRAIPLFNRLKDNNNKINAWVELAEMYQINNRYTEAQWFLIQAKELAEENNIKAYDLKIEYHLGYAKFQQKNYNVSRKELETAMGYALQEKNQLIVLSSLQMLAQISYNQRKFTEAEEILNSYIALKKQIF